MKDQEPKGIHLVFGQDPSSQLNIVWWTSGPVNSALVYYSLVDVENELVATDELVCNHNMTQKGFIGRNSTFGKYVHRVFMNGLLPNRRYCYEITSGHASSHIYTFRTADLSIHLGKLDDSYRHSNFVINPNDLTLNEDKENNEFLNEENRESLSFLIESIKYRILDKKLNAFINLPSTYLNGYSIQNYANSNLNPISLYQNDFLGQFSEFLSAMPLITTFEDFGRFF